jgi:COP9 signalosome complex subunit 6
MLLGTMQGRKIDVHNSGEVNFTIGSGGEVVFDQEILNKRLDMYHQIFPDFEFLGWYTTGELAEHDIET